MISFWGNAQISPQQRVELDSLLTLSKTTKDPVLLIEICKLYRDNNADSSILYAEKAVRLAQQNNDGYNEAMALAGLAASYRYVEDSYELTIENFKKAGEVFHRIGDKEKEGRIYNNIGVEYDFMGDYPVALEYYIKAFKIYEEIGYEQGQSEAMNNMGLMYELMDDTENAMKYYQQSASISFEIGDSLGWSMSVANIAVLYNYLGEYEKSIEHYNLAIKIREAIGEEKSLTQVYNNLGGLYYDMGDTLKSLELMEKTLQLNIEKNAYKSIAVNSYNIGCIYHDWKDYDKAKQYYLKALDIARNYHYYNQEKDYQGALSNLYADIDDYESAFNALLRYIEINDTLFNEEKERASLELKEAYETEKKDITIAKQKAEIDVELAINSRNKMLLYLSIGILGLVIIFIIVLYGRIRTIKLQKKKIELQKKEEYRQRLELQEKNKEITDSIQYAKRIQAAILPSDKLVKEYLENSFILYKPKDIVAGDFYWMETVSSSSFKEGVSRTEQPDTSLDAIPNTFGITRLPAGTARDDRTILFAAADCTGHGVPGAMVSVVCHNALNRSVKEYGLLNPADILNKTREIVVKEFEKSEEEVKDGMDIALCRLELVVPGSMVLSSSDSENISSEKIEELRTQSSEYGTIEPQTAAKLQYAGANNPLWICRNGEIIEIKGDKQPIGKFDHSSNFTCHDIELIKGDTIYIFSDGYVDQFGGERGKKLKSSNFKKLLLSIQNETMTQQRELIDAAFENWRGEMEQIDDVCIIGVRI